MRLCRSAPLKTAIPRVFASSALFALLLLVGCAGTFPLATGRGPRGAGTLDVGAGFAYRVELRNDKGANGFVGGHPSASLRYGVTDHVDMGLAAGPGGAHADGRWLHSLGAESKLVIGLGLDGGWPTLEDEGNTHAFVRGELPIALAMPLANLYEIWLGARPALGDDLKTNRLFWELGGVLGLSIGFDQLWFYLELGGGYVERNGKGTGFIQPAMGMTLRL